MTKTPVRSAVLWLLSFILAAAFVAFQIQSSFHSGALSLPATYDDVNYFNDALPRLDILYREGGRAFLSGLWTKPPHAPLQSLLVLVGFGLFGPHPWAADAMNALPLALLLRLLLGLACRTLPLMVSVALAVALLGFPLLGLMVLEFRPDMLCALLTAAGALVIVADPRWRDGHHATSYLTTALFVGALLAKPTLAPVTVVVFGVAALAAAGLHSKSRGDAMRMARIAVLSGGLGALIVLPYYIAALPRLIDYIQVNVFGSQANIWRQNFSAREHALYYLTGQGGNVAVGRAWLAVTCALVIAALPALIRSRRSTLAVVVVIIAAYGSVTVPTMKSPFLGLIVPSLILGVIAILAIEVLRRLPVPVALAVAFGLVAVSAATWRPVSVRMWNSAASVAQIENYKRIYSETVDALATVPHLEQRRLYFPLIGQYLNQDNVAFELRRRGLPVPPTPELYFNRNLADHKAAIDQSDLVVLFSDDTTLPIPWPASVTIRKEIGAAVAATGSFEPIATVDGGPYLGSVIVLKRKGT